MSFGAYVVGGTLLAVAVVPIAIAAVQLRKSAISGLSFAEARLAEAIIGLAILILVLELAGAAGEFRRVAVVCACAGAGVVGILVARRLRVSPPTDRTAGDRNQVGDPADTSVPPVEGRLLLGGASLAAIWVVAKYIGRAKLQLGSGMVNPDTLWYHMPTAARFVQSGSILGHHLTWPDPQTSFYPMNAELLHAFSLLLLGRDSVSPVLNLVWLPIAFLAGYSAGRPRGLGSLGLLAVSMVVGAFIVVAGNAGEATNDLMALTLVVSSAALLIISCPSAGSRDQAGFAADGRARALLVIAAIAAGLAAGTKLNVLAVVVALSLGAVWLARPRTWSLLWLVPVVLTGGFWYLRNLIRSGNPLPWIGAHLGPIVLPSPPMPDVSKFGDPLVHYLTNPHALSTVVSPGFKYAYGPLWALLFAGAVMCAVLALALGPSVARVCGLGALVGGVAYVVTPGTGAIGGSFAGVNSRYAAPAIALACIAFLATRGIESRASRGVAALALGSLFVVMQVQPNLRDLGRPTNLEVFAVIVPLVGAGAIIWARRPDQDGWGSAPIIVAGAAVGTVVLAVGWVVDRHYLANRYAKWPVTVSQAPWVGPLVKVFTWARPLHGQRIGVSGTRLQYPLYGADESNYVQYIGRRGAHGSFYSPASCTEWRRLLDAGHYRYVVVTPYDFPFIAHSPSPPEYGWTAADPEARRILADRGGAVAVFQLQGGSGSTRGCGAQ